MFAGRYKRQRGRYKSWNSERPYFKPERSKDCTFLRNINVKASSEYISHFSTATCFTPLRRRHTMSRPFASFKGSESVFPFVSKSWINDSRRHHNRRVLLRGLPQHFLPLYPHMRDKSFPSLKVYSGCVATHGTLLWWTSIRNMVKLLIQGDWLPFMMKWANFARQILLNIHGYAVQKFFFFKSPKKRVTF